MFYLKHIKVYSYTELKKKRKLSLMTFYKKKV